MSISLLTQMHVSTHLMEYHLFQYFHIFPRHLCMLIISSTLYLPRVHAQGGKVIGSVVVSTKIAISRDTGV